MFEIHVNAQDVAVTVDAMALQQVPFALSRALNQTALDFQEAERVRMRTVFTLRRQSFDEKQGVKILGGFARKNRLTVTIGQDPKADFFAKFEAGGEKRSLIGGNIAIPVDARRNKSDIIAASQRPKALFESGANVFEIRPGDTSNLVPGIYQVLGKGKRRHLKMLYAVKPEVAIGAVFEFGATAERIVSERWAINFGEEFAFALGTAR